MKIVCIAFKDEWGNPQNYDLRNQSHGIKEIAQYNVQGEGDKWYWNVVLNNGNEIMVFNPCQVYKEKE